MLCYYELTVKIKYKKKKNFILRTLLQAIYIDEKY